jgi:hypothetical protein
MSRIILQKKGNALVVTDEESATAVAHIKEGAEVYAELVRGKNMKQHRKFFALAAIVAESMDLTTDSVRKDALIRLGYTDTRIDVDGRIRIEPKSMRVIDGMKQEEFDAFMDKAVNLMAGWINADHKDLMRRFNEIAADKRYSGMRRE